MQLSNALNERLQFANSYSTIQEHFPSFQILRIFTDHAERGYIKYQILSLASSC